MELDASKTSGPAMASLLHSLSTSQEDFDGLLFGAYWHESLFLISDGSPRIEILI